MDPFQTELMTKVNLLAGYQVDIRVDIAEIKRDIAHHIKRTDAAETNLDLLRVDVSPIKKHVAMMEGALKLVGIVALLVTLIGGALKIFDVL